MKMHKRAYDTDGTPITEPMAEEIYVQIKGLREVPGQPGFFALADVKMRQVDYAGLTIALGYDAEDPPEALLERVQKAVWGYEITEILATRIKPA